MRIDAHHSSSHQYTLDYLASILKRNRFERSILVGPPAAAPDFVAGIIAPLLDFTPDARIVGVQAETLSDLENIPPALPIDLLHLLPHVPLIARLHRDRPLIVDHLGFPPSATWDLDIERAAQFPNVYCKLSGLTMFGEPRPYVQRALALFGPSRLMFGSDWPNGLPEHTWKSNLAAFTQSIGAQTIDVREQLLGGTAARCYRLAL